MHFLPRAKNLGIVPLELKELTSLNAFKNGIKNSNQKTALAGYVRNTY